jgi:hypothetical protein
MSDLSPAARSLLRDGQSLLRPSLGDRTRVAQALTARLGDVGLACGPEAATVAAKTLALPKLSALIVGAGLVSAGAAYMLWPSTPSPAPKAAASAAAVPSSRPVGAPVAVASPASVEPAVEAGTPESPPPSAPKPALASDRLAEEVSILSRATSELRAHRPGDALRLLDEHQRRFPGGRLVEERRAARIQALCALGNRSAAESELTRLARSSPRSPHLARAQKACNFSSAELESMKTP